MTRITDFGRKRTYVEAGFADTDDAVKPAPPVVPMPAANDAPPSAEPVKKKRKRAGKPGRIPGAAPKPAQPAQPSTTADVGSEEAKRLSYKAKKLRKLKVKKGQLLPPEPPQFKAKHAADGGWSKFKDVNRKFSEQRRTSHASRRDAALTCFSCREQGHSAANCPRSSGVGICYRCGVTSHSLSSCPAPALPSDALPFASCFVCSSTGHLASACPHNAARGVYPNGGCCKLCRQTTHLAKNCPTKNNAAGSEQTRTSAMVGSGAGAGADEDDFHTIKRTTAEHDRAEKKQAKAPPTTKAKKVVHF